MGIARVREMVEIGELRVEQDYGGGCYYGHK